MNDDMYIRYDPQDRRDTIHHDADVNMGFWQKYKQSKIAV